MLGPQLFGAFLWATAYPKCLFGPGQAAWADVVYLPLAHHLHIQLVALPEIDELTTRTATVSCCFYRPAFEASLFSEMSSRGLSSHPVSTRCCERYHKTHCDRMCTIQHRRCAHLHQNTLNVPLCDPPLPLNLPFPARTKSLDELDKVAVRTKTVFRLAPYTAMESQGLKNQCTTLRCHDSPLKAAE